jgi:hypothetical protein
VRVFDGDEWVGVVDDEDILRVVVAEDEPIEGPADADRPTTADAHTPARRNPVEQAAGR